MHRRTETCRFDPLSDFDFVKWHLDQIATSAEETSGDDRQDTEQARADGREGGSVCDIHTDVAK